MLHFIFTNIWLLLLVTLVSSVSITGFCLFYRDHIRFFRWALNKIFPSTTPSWKIIMGVLRDGVRPRYLSLHTLATLLGRTDLLQLAKEMKRSCEVNASYCGEVHTPVFYLNRFSELNSRKTWKDLQNFIKLHPFPETRGFQRADGHWTEGYGRGKFIPPVHAMPEPFIKEDYAYANKIIRALRAAGREPGIKEYIIDNA